MADKDPVAPHLSWLARQRLQYLSLPIFLAVLFSAISLAFALAVLKPWARGPGARPVHWTTYPCVLAFPGILVPFSLAMALRSLLTLRRVLRAAPLLVSARVIGSTGRPAWSSRLARLAKCSCS